MKRGAKLCVLLGALLVLVGAWYLATSLSDRQEAEQAEQAHEEPTDLAVGPEKDITALAWDYFGDAVSLVREDGTWINADDEGCPIDQEMVAPLAEAAASAAASAVITDVTDFEQYGLADPAFTIVAGTADQVNTYQIGKPSATGAYYIRMNGEETVYVDAGMLAQTFQVGMNDILQLETLPNPEDVKGLTVDTEAGSYALRLLSNAGEVWYTDAAPWFLMDEEGSPLRPLDTEQTKTLYQLAAGIALTDCEDWSAGDGADYGLDEPQGTVRLDYDGADSVTLEFGSYDNGDVYVRLAGSQLVYRVSGTVLDGLMYPDFDAMAPLAPCALDWEKLESFTLETDGDSYEVIRSVSTPGEEDEEPEDIYTLEDRSLDAGSVTAWLRQVYEMPADSRTDPTEGRGELFTLTFRQDSEDYPEVTARFCAYDSVHYLCVVNGEEYYLVSRTTAESVKDKALGFLIELPQT